MLTVLLVESTLGIPTYVVAGEGGREALASPPARQPASHPTSLWPFVATGILHPGTSALAPSNDNKP